MSGLFGALGATTTALDAQTQAISIANNNIANINNPNYSRETVSYLDLPSVATAGGLQSTGISTSVAQTRSAVLDQMVRQEASLTAGFSSAQGLLQQAQASLGEDITNSSTAATSGSTSSTNTSGLSAALNDFFNAVQGYAANPTDASEAQALVQQAGVLTDRFQQIDQGLAQVQADAAQQVGSDVGTANRLLQQVAQLNGQIASAEISDPGSALQLRDQREGELEQLAGIMPISVTENAKGEDLVTTADASGNPVTLVNNAAVVNPLSVSGGTVQAGSTALGVSSGSIHGELSASGGAVQTLRDDLDALAGQIVASVNQAYNPGGASGGNFFAAGGTAAGTIAVDPALNAATLSAGTGAAGDNSLALAVAAVANRKFSKAGGDAIDGTLTQFYAGSVSALGQSLVSVNTQAANQSAVQTLIVNQRQSASGVSVDEEMSNLMTYQRAFQASSEVFQVIDSLLKDLVTTLGSV